MCPRHSFRYILKAFGFIFNKNGQIPDPDRTRDWVKMTPPKTKSPVIDSLIVLLGPGSARVIQITHITSNPLFSVAVVVYLQYRLGVAGGRSVGWVTSFSSVTFRNCPSSMAKISLIKYYLR